MSRIEDILYVRFRVSDLEAQRRFLEDFGFATERTGGLLLARGTDPRRYVYVAEEGTPEFVSVGFEASNMATLEALAAMDGRPIEDNPLPGGGKRVRLTDPSGISVEVVFGIDPVAALPVPERAPINDSNNRRRLGQRVEFDFSGPYIKRLGHCVLMVNDFRTSEAWYKARFDFITSDEITTGDNGRAMGAFLRCNQGDNYVDHHTLFLIHAGRVEFNHAAFEVSDWDVLMKSHFDLKRSGYRHSFGVGKHILGSQVFDYWKDPNGFTLEHFTDGDLFNEASGSFVKTTNELMGTIWGPDGMPGA